MVSTTASHALESITGVRFGLDSRRWKSWHQREVDWWNRESPRVLLALEIAEGSEFHQAVLEGLKRTLYRDRIAASLVLRLRDDDADRVRLSCAALAQLKTGFSLGDLVDCLSHGDMEVRKAAHEALVGITGKDIPINGRLWQEALTP